MNAIEPSSDVLQIKTTPSDLNKFIKYQEKIKDDVNVQMSSLANIHELLGDAPMQLMYDNHNHHLQFMLTVFKYHSVQMLQKSIPWVYHRYTSHGFSYDYFPVELEAWKNAIIKFIGEESAITFTTVYQWMIDHHEHMIELSKKPLTQIDKHPELRTQKAEFSRSILAGDLKSSLHIAQEMISRENGQELLYTALIEPVMSEIGQLWERNIVSSAEEHLATSMVSRVMALLYSEIPPSSHKKGIGVITVGPNEPHQLGPRVLADLLEKEGWNIHFLGANTPESEIIELLLNVQPRFLGFSVTLPFNIDGVTQLIGKIKKIVGLSALKIIVGGQAFQFDDELWKKTGADAYADSLKASVKQINQW